MCSRDPCMRSFFSDENGGCVHQLACRAATVTPT